MAENDEILDTRVVREVAAVFHREDVLEDAIQALLLAGFDRGDIDIMGDIETVRQRLGAHYVPAEEIADVPGTPRRAYIARDDITTATAGVAGMLFYLGAATAAMTVKRLPYLTPGLKWAPLRGDQTSTLIPNHRSQSLRF